MRRLIQTIIAFPSLASRFATRDTPRSLLVACTWGLSCPTISPRRYGFLGTMAAKGKDTKATPPAATVRRGRPPKFASAAARQKAYRDRRKQAGKAADTKQETIKSLREELLRLKSTGRDDEISITALRQSALDLERRNSALQARCEMLDADLAQTRFRKNDRLQELLAKRIIMRNRDLAAVFLVDYLGKPMERGQEFEAATKEAQEFGRKAAQASSNIVELVEKLTRRQQMTAEETAVLKAANAILADIHNRSTTIKVTAKSLAARIKLEEEGRARASKTAVGHAFPKVSVPEAVLLAMHLRLNHSWALNRISQIRPEQARAWDLDDYIEELSKEVLHELESLVANAMKGGQPAKEAAEALRAAFDAERPRLEQQHRGLIEQITTCQVAAELGRAAR